MLFSLVSVMIAGISPAITLPDSSAILTLHGDLNVLIAWRFKCIDFPDIFKNNARNLNTIGRGTLHRTLLESVLDLCFSFFVPKKSNENESCALRRPVREE